MATALVLGLGTSGLHIIEECQQFHYQFTGKNKPDSVRYLYFETNTAETAATTTMGQTDIKPVYISLKQIGAQVNQLQRQLNNCAWIPPVDAALAAGNGAGGNSAYGRLALWINYTAVREAILQNWQQIKDGNNSTYIFIVGTLTGGTGSGTCVDMAYLVRDITKSDNVFGLFLTPSRQQLSQGGTDALFYNYFSAISAIQHYSDGANPYDVVWPNGSPYRNNTPPYKQCYFLSQDYTNNFAPIASVSELYKVAGLHIFSRIHSFGEIGTDGQPLPNFSATIDRRLQDIQGNVDGYKFSTFGTKLIYYPKGLLKEMFGLKLSKDILNQWANPNSYVESKQDVSIASRLTQIKGIVKRDFETKLAECLNVVDGQNTANNISLLDEVGGQNVLDLASKNYQTANANAFIYQLFTANSSANHFALVNNNRITIRDQFVNYIYELFETKLEQYQNLQVGIVVLETIIESIRDVLQFWTNEYGIDGQFNTWNRILQRRIAQIMSQKTLPSLLAQRKTYFKEQLVNILTLCKMNIAIEELKNIADTISTAQVPLRTQSRELPTIQHANNVLALIRGIVSYTDRSVKGVVTLERRENEIRANLTTNTPNFSTIFDKGSLDGDLADLDREYKNNYQNTPFKATDVTGGQTTWAYLENIKREQLYEDCITRSIAYVNKTLPINKTIVNLLKNLTPRDAQWQDISTFINDNKTNILSKLPGLEELRSNMDVFSPHEYLTLIYLNGDIAALSKLMQYSIKVDNDSACELSGLTDAIIVFQEYGYMGAGTPPFNPMTHIGISDTIRQRILNNINYEANEVAYPNVFVFKRRVPYLTKEQFEGYLHN